MLSEFKLIWKNLRVKRDNETFENGKGPARPEARLGFEINRWKVDRFHSTENESSVSYKMYHRYSYVTDLDWINLLLLVNECGHIIFGYKLFPLVLVGPLFF